MKLQSGAPTSFPWALQNWPKFFSPSNFLLLLLLEHAYSTGALSFSLGAATGTEAPADSLIPSI